MAVACIMLAGVVVMNELIHCKMLLSRVLLLLALNFHLRRRNETKGN